MKNIEKGQVRIFFFQEDECIYFVYHVANYITAAAVRSTTYLKTIKFDLSNYRVCEIINEKIKKILFV